MGKTRVIKLLITAGLLVLAALNVYLLLLIARTIPGSALDILTAPTESAAAFIPPAPGPTPEPTPVIAQQSTPTEPATPLFMPLSARDISFSDLRSPFSLQIAALHQVSISPGAQGDDSDGASQTQADFPTFGQGPYSSLAEALKDSGADWARVRIEWELIEPNKPIPGQPPEYDWKYHDDNLRLLSQAGVRMIATLSDSPGWAASVPCAPIYPDRLDEYARYLADLVARYKEPPFYIKYWELVNEPDSNRYATGHISGHGCWAYDGEQYAQMLAVASRAIREADPEAAILMGGIAYDWFEQYGGPFFRYFPDDVMINGGGEYIDALNIHFFTDFRAEWDRWNPDSVDRQFGWISAPTCGTVDDGVGTSYEVTGFDVVAKATHFQNRMAVCYGVTKPIWVTEVGGHGYPGNLEALEEQARYIVKVYTRGLSAGVKNITWFSLDQPPYDPYGQALLNPDFSPKPAFFAFQVLTRELDGFYTYSHDRNICSWSSAGPACSVEAYVFQDDAQNEKTVAWGSQPLDFQAEQLRVADHQGSESFILDGGDGDQDGLQNGVIEFLLSADPVFITVQ